MCRSLPLRRGGCGPGLGRLPADKQPLRNDRGAFVYIRSISVVGGLTGLVVRTIASKALRRFIQRPAWLQGEEIVFMCCSVARHPRNTPEYNNIVTSRQFG